MQTIGERLEEARKRKGVSLREAAEATKIRGDYLHKFESNQYDIKLPEIYVRGFLRTYANFLKLPADKIAAEFESLGHAASRGPRMPSREIYGRMDLSVASGASAAAVEAQPAPPAEESEPESAPARRPAQTFRSGMPSPGVPIDVILKIAFAAIAIIVAVLLVVWGVKMAFSGPKKSAPTITAGEPVAAQPLPEQTVTLVALGPLDVQVKQELDGKIIYRGTLSAGERMSIVKRGAILVTYTVGKNLQLEINGHLYGMPTTGYDRARIE